MVSGQCYLWHQACFRVIWDLIMFYTWNVLSGRPFRVLDMVWYAKNVLVEEACHLPLQDVDTAPPPSSYRMNEYVFQYYVLVRCIMMI